MTTTNQIIDFEELLSAVPGEGLEQLVRLLARRKGLSPAWSGRGSDQGRDLILSETLIGPLTRERVTWLVSCKDKAKSRTSVTERELPSPSIKDKVAQHKANGFLLVTTTTVSTGAKALLDSLDKSNGGDLHILIWDASELTSMLLQPDNQDLLKQFLPTSYQRVKGLTSIEGALLAFQDQIPEDIWNETMRLLKPYSELPLKGSVIWPFNKDVGRTIDRIVRHLLIESNVLSAVIETENLEYDVFIQLVERMTTQYPRECRDYLFAIILHHSKLDMRINAAIYLYDNYEVTIEEGLHIANKLDTETLSDLYGMDISDLVSMEIVDGFWFYDQTGSLAKLSADAKIVDARITSLTLQGNEEKKILFEGKFQANVKYRTDEGITEKAGRFFGDFRGYIDEYGIQMENIALLSTD